MMRSPWWEPCLTVLSNAVLEPGVYAGIPAKKVKDSSEAVCEAAHKNAQGYLMYKEWYK